MRAAKPARLCHLPPGGFPGFAGRNDSGDFNLSGQFGVAGENGPVLVFIAEVSLMQIPMNLI